MNMGETNLKWQYNRYDGTLNTASKKRLRNKSRNLTLF